MRRPPEVSAELPYGIDDNQNTNPKVSLFCHALIVVKNLSKLEHVATSLPHCCHLGDNRQVVDNKANLKHM